MPNFTAGTSFGANDTVTNTKLNALIADATINPECSFSINSGTIGTLGCTRGTVATLNSTTGTIATLNTTTGSVQTLSAGTLATNLTGGTYSGLISGLINSSTGTIQTLTASTLTGVLTGGTYTGSLGGTIGTSCNFTAGTIATFVATNNATIQGLNLGKGSGNIATNTSFGSSSLKANTTGSLNTAIGFETLSSNTTGQILTAIGYRSLSSNTTGFGNTAVGNSSLLSNQTGNLNTAIGVSSLFPNTSGSNNTAVGSDSLFYNTTGANNTAVGYQAGYSASHGNTTGSNNTFIGNGAVNTAGGSTASNTIVLGNSASTALRCQTQTILALSDARDKSNIEEIPIGIDFIKDLRPVKFTWNQRDGMRVGLTDAGFIAQESLDVVNKHKADWMGLVDHQNPDHIEMSYGKLIPVLVKAVQQLSAKVDSLEAQLASK